MRQDSRTISSAAIVGLGTIGCSIGLDLRAQGWRVDGYDCNRFHAGLARRMGAIDREAPSLDALGAPALVIVATPPHAVVDVSLGLLRQGAHVVTDVASIKSQIAGAIDDPRFVPSHPMAGSEKSGPDGARADLFLGATWVVTPSSVTSVEAVNAVMSMARAVGSIPLVMDPGAHDDAVALISHVPHLAAVAVAALVGDGSDADEVLELAGRGFRDVTRIAKGDPALWTSIATGNPALASHLRRLSRLVAAMAEAVAEGDQPLLNHLLTRGQAAALRADAIRTMPPAPPAAAESH